MKHEPRPRRLLSQPCAVRRHLPPEEERYRNSSAFSEVLFVMMDTKLSMRLRKVTSAPNFRKIYLEDDVTVEPTGKNAFRIGSDSFENEPVYFVEGAKGEIVGVRWRTYLFEKANPR